MLEASSPDGRVLGIDRDPGRSPSRARGQPFGERVTIVEGALLGDRGACRSPCRFLPADGVIADLGSHRFSSSKGERGFNSFSTMGRLI